jgi:hypothetical protein
MVKEDRRNLPLDVVTAARGADLRILQLAVAGLRRFVRMKRLYVITAPANFGRFRRALGPEVELLDEDSMTPEVTLDRLRSFALPGLPQGAGWYLQQFDKLAFSFRPSSDDYYLIWDSDTIPLRPLEFFDAEGKMCFTISGEEHPPYFETYRKLLREEPHREFSFISQHMIVQKSIVREMLAKIEANVSGDDSWAWKIMRQLEGTHPNLFSEYETLGHYLKANYPERATYRRLPWSREAALETKGVPSAADLARLTEKYFYATFESGQMPLRKFLKDLRSFVRGKPAFRYQPTELE